MKHWSSDARRLAAGAFPETGASRLYDTAPGSLDGFPLLIDSTAIACGAGYTITGRFLIPNAAKPHNEHTGEQLLAGLALLLFRLNPLSLYMGVVLLQASEGPLGEYELSLRIHLLLLTITGALARAQQLKVMLSIEDDAALRATFVLCVWLALSALVEGPGATSLRSVPGWPRGLAEQHALRVVEERTLRGSRLIIEASWFSFDAPEARNGAVPNLG